MRDVPGTRNVLAERTAGGYYLDFVLDRDALARYGLSVEDAQTIVMSAIGGETVTTTVEGRERYAVNVRYAREFRDDLPRRCAACSCRRRRARRSRWRRSPTSACSRGRR